MRSTTLAAACLFGMALPAAAQMGGGGGPAVERPAVAPLAIPHRAPSLVPSLVPSVVPLLVPAAPQASGTMPAPAPATEPGSGGPRLWLAQGSRAYTQFIVPEGGSSQFFKIPPAAPLSFPAARAPLLADGPRLRQVRLAAMVGGISPAVRQALQQDSARIRACDQARVALRTGLYTPSGGAEPSFAMLAQRARDPAVGALLRAHDAACLRVLAIPADADGEAGRVATAVEAVLPRIGSVVVALGPQSGEVICTGLLLDARHVATARHCLYHRGGANAPAARIEVAFARWAEPHQALPAALVAEDPDYAGAAFNEQQRRGDFALLRLAQPLADARLNSPIAVGTPQVFQRITIFGMQTLLAYAGGRAPPHIRPEQGWSPLLRHEVRADCRIAWTTPRGCFFYGCNTEGGWSGGPVFAIADPASDQPAEPVLLGIHTGGLPKVSLAPDETDCGKRMDYGGLRSSFLNVGTQVPGWVARTAIP